jgi:hypothetical protein
VVEHIGAQEALLARLAADGSQRHVRIYRGMTRPFDLPLWDVTRELSRAHAVSARRRAVLAGRLRQAVETWDHVSAGALAPSGKSLLLSLARRLEGPDSAHAIGDALVSAIVDANKQARRDAVFATLDVVKAREWAKRGNHGVIAVDLSLARLAELSRRAEIYVGTEGDVEIAFISRDAQELLMTRWTLLVAPRDWPAPASQD